MTQDRQINERNQDLSNGSNSSILSARIHEYQKPLSIDSTPKPTISTGEQVLVKVAGSRSMSQRFTFDKWRLEGNYSNKITNCTWT